MDINCEFISKLCFCILKYIIHFSDNDVEIDQIKYKFDEISILYISINLSNKSISYINFITEYKAKDSHIVKLFFEKFSIYLIIIFIR